MAGGNIQLPGRSSLNLGGCGFAAAHSLGPIKFAQEHSKIVFIEGVSAGALVAAILISCDFNIEKLIRVWLEIDQLGASHIFLTKNRWGVKDWVGKSWYINDGIKELINRYVNADKLLDWEGECIFVADNITRGRNFAFSTKPQDERLQKRLKENPEVLKEAILASASLAPLLPPIVIDGEWYRDGGTCSLVASDDRDIDNIFVVLNHRLDEGAGEHQEEEWNIYQGVNQFRAAVRNSVVKDIKYLKSIGYKIIEQNPTDLFDNVKVRPGAQLKLLVKDTIDAVNPLSLEPLEDRVITRKLAPIFTPTNSVRSITTDKFPKGDIKLAINRSIKETEEFAERIEKEL